ncbi:unnamed protein product [Paramecium pentaurelia]|uniref:Uncharacterized protein n=1 Tax=Paramecium pentaurelia TaxID=43138 RepID=A0A8S1YME5_9CILI|nr:unnamed protein product [Paramecium pentaurelia]
MNLQFKSLLIFIEIYLDKLCFKGKIKKAQRKLKYYHQHKIKALNTQDNIVK